MRPQALLKLSVLVVLLLVVPVAVAQKTSAYPKYDPSKEIKLKGTIEEVKSVAAGNGETAIELLVKSAGETAVVRLCPERFLKEFDLKFAAGELAEITGAKAMIADKEVVLAREIVRGSDTVVLRDKRGEPVWTWLKPTAEGK